MFSNRVPPSLAPNELTRRLATLRAEAVEIVDLTASNPTRAGFKYPRSLMSALAERSGLTYDPRPFGLPAARAAVATDFERRGQIVSPDRIVLTASTSEAYSLVFKLLCDPGDAVLVPRPSYPLFDHLTRLDGIDAVPYLLEYDGRWRLDAGELRRRLSARVRAILVVNPNNPTSSYLTREDMTVLAAVTRDTGIAVIGDEVFADYALEDDPERRPSVLDLGEIPTFCLGGLSKSVGLPQLKLAWIVVGGPDALVVSALDRLEYICDAYLSVSTPVQLAAPTLLRIGARVREAIQKRIRDNYAWLCREVLDSPAIGLLPAEGGWYAVIRVPAVRSEEALVLELLTLDHVLVHPGYFFDFPHEAYLVMSLLPRPELFRAGMARVLARAASG